MFKSSQGFYRLNRSLQLEPIGIPVSAYNSTIVTSAVALNENTQVRFLAGLGGVTVLYDWFYDSWSTFTLEGVAAVRDTVSGLFTYINETGYVLQETLPTYGYVYSDNGVPFSMQVTTAWIKCENIQGFGRIWKTFLLGQFPGSQQYTVEFAFDYVDAPTDTIILNPNAGTYTSTWGTDDGFNGSYTWGNNAGGYWGATGATEVLYPNQIQFKLYNQTQLCESIQITMYDSGVLNPSVNWSLDALSLECGVRKGGMKFLGNPQTGG